ncbi:C40 family peptidase [Pseudoneobacillus sp. C159]
MKKHLIGFAAAAGILLTGFNGQASAHDLTYKVQSGDTLWKIATANNVNLTDLKAWNNLSSDSIYVNQSLSLLPPHTHTNSESVTYTVKTGDSLSIIAKNFGLTVDEFRSMNKLRFDIIFPGQILKVGTAVQETNTTEHKFVTSTSVSSVDTLVTEAKKHIGTPYVWGGTTPSGFDCSGYLNFVYAKAGITLPRTVASIWSETKAVANPKVGDIVFFETYTSGPSHAGIYLGNNKFIHAGSSTGITISDLTNSYWKARYLGAKTTSAL